jgi:hypothetical protein
VAFHPKSATTDRLAASRATWGGGQRGSSAWRAWAGLSTGWAQDCAGGRAQPVLCKRLRVMLRRWPPLLHGGWAPPVLWPPSCRGSSHLQRAAVLSCVEHADHRNVRHVHADVIGAAPQRPQSRAAGQRGLRAAAGRTARVGAWGHAAAERDKRGRGGLQLEGDAMAGVGSGQVGHECTKQVGDEAQPGQLAVLRGGWGGGKRGTRAGGVWQGCKPARGDGKRVKSLKVTVGAWLRP